MLICVSSEGTPVASDVATIQDIVPAHGTTAFQMNGVFSDLSVCENFLIAGTGHP